MQWVDSERSSPVVSLGLCIVLTLFIFGVGALVTAKLYSGVQRLTSTELRLGELNGVIVHHDEVLTMSAYMVAQTGETKWEDRYRRYEVPLEAAIKEMQATVPGAVAEHATQKTDAANHALIEMEKTNAAVIAGKAGDRLTNGLQAIIEKYSLPFVAYNQGSIVHLETAGTMLLDLKHPLRLLKELKPRKHMMEEMGAAYMANGLVTLAGSRMYTSMADTEDVIDDALDRFETVLKECQ